MDNMSKREKLLCENCVAGDVKLERRERIALEPGVAQPIDTITVGCGEVFTLICC